MISENGRILTDDEQKIQMNSRQPEDNIEFIT